jgi:hypothetical protein
MASVNWLELNFEIALEERGIRRRRQGRGTKSRSLD